LIQRKDFSLRLEQRSALAAVEIAPADNAEEKSF
jgi:hypothetical protein